MPDHSPAVFLDRDGTLILDVGYCARPEEVSLLPGVREGLRQLKAWGFRLIIVTNQSGIGRGYFSVTDFLEVQRELEAQLGNGLIDATYFCPDLPEHASERRKPGAGMLLEAARDHAVQLAASFMIGDSEIDMEAGRRAGLQASIRVHAPRDTPPSRDTGFRQVIDFAAAVRLIAAERERSIR